MNTLISALAITVAAAITVALWTLRVALAARGSRAASAAIAGVEAVLFAVVFTGLVTNLGDPVRLTAYAVGMAGGTLLGLLVDERFSSGQSEVRLIVPGDGDGLTARLHAAGWPATSTPATGPSGRATSVLVTVDNRRVTDLLAVVDGADPEPFVTVGRLRSARPVSLSSGFIQVGDPSARRLLVTSKGGGR